MGHTRHGPKALSQGVAPRHCPKALSQGVVPRRCPKALPQGIAPSVSLRGACTAVCAGNEAIPGPRRVGRGGTVSFLMSSETGLSPPASARPSLRFAPMAQKGDCPLHSTPSGTVTPFGPAPPSKALAVANLVRSDGAMGSSKGETVPLGHPFPVPGLLRRRHIKAVPTPRNDGRGPGTRPYPEASPCSSCSPWLILSCSSWCPFVSSW
jgi:hypothetical protein